MTLSMAAALQSAIGLRVVATLPSCDKFTADLCRSATIFAMSSIDADSTQTSRMRLLEAGKSLFARYGFEQTSTAMIAKEAGTSESPLVRYYKTKAGLLESIFNDSWARLNGH